MNACVSLQALGLGLRTGSRWLLHEVDFSLPPGVLLGIVGPNGAGKTSLLRVLLDLRRPDAGSVHLQGRALKSWPMMERARRMAYLAQNQQVHWAMPVRDVVALGRLPHGDAGQPHGRHIVEHAMQMADCHALAQRNVQILSGGERARVLLARALAVQAQVLLADEPLAALDPAHQLRMMTHLRQQASQGMAVAVVLHDLGLASRYCDQILLMHQGRVLAAGAPRQVLTDAALRQAFELQVLRVQQDAQTGIVPWKVVAADPPDGG